jgi:hypothetical protein
MRANHQGQRVQIKQREEIDVPNSRSIVGGPRIFAGRIGCLTLNPGRGCVRSWRAATLEAAVYGRLLKHAEVVDPALTLSIVPMAVSAPSFEIEEASAILLHGARCIF